MLHCSNPSSLPADAAARTVDETPCRPEPPRDWSPRFEPETESVSFYVLVRGMRVKSFVTRDWLVSHFGPDVPADQGMVDVYLRHARTIDSEIMRRVAVGRIEPVWLASCLPPIG